ncbi:unnamed protein product [Schistocephalus solidus]|uniref:Uncharacterized protein n=1 Tax=Schistocephalus solidus TaxID=70667 RepID=A0A3P7D6Y0_SCHSO|nr:unnamed protein product [Schistocephalus solidus]
MQSENVSFERGRTPRALILAPTRELANQISTVIDSISCDKLSVLAVYGGVPYQAQTRALKNGVDVVVGAPGRVIDLLESQKLNLQSVRLIVLDEVDRMLDMGFSADVEKILSSLYEEGKSSKPQTLLFSATLPSWVSQIAGKYVSKTAHRVTLVNEKESRTVDTVKHLALLCPPHERAATIADVIRVYSHGPSSRCIVFCERKKDADELASHSAMAADCHVFHGDIPQDKRELVLQKFREGKYKTLITTNVAARGLDIPDVELVIQCAPPSSAEDYIHRSGRTGRAGRNGISVCFYSMRQRQQLNYIENGTGIHFRRISAPSPTDIVEVWTRELSESFAKLPESTWSVFLPAARNIVRALKSNTEGTSWPDGDESRADEDVKPSKKSKKLKKSKQEDFQTDTSISFVEEREEDGDMKLKKSKKSKKSNCDDSQTELSTSVTECERALCCALARISGKTKAIESRSMLTAQAGLTAYKLTVPPHVTAHRKGLAYSLLNQQLSPEVTENIKNLAFIKDRTGFVFDLPDVHNAAIEENWQNHDGLILEKLNELPELEPEADELNNGGSWRFSGGGRGFRGARGGGWRGRNNFGGPRRFGSGNGGPRGFGFGRGRGGFSRDQNERGGTEFGVKRSLNGPLDGSSNPKSRRLDL